MSESQEKKQSLTGDLVNLWYWLSKILPELIVFTIVITVLGIRTTTDSIQKTIELKVENVVDGAHLIENGNFVNLIITQKFNDEVKLVTSANHLEVLDVLDNEGNPIEESGNSLDHAILSVPENRLEEITDGLDMSNISITLDEAAWKYIELKVESVTSGANLLDAGDLIELRILQRVTGASKEIAINEIVSVTNVRVLYVLDEEGKDITQSGKSANRIILSIPEEKFEIVTKGLHTENIAVYLLPHEEPSLDISPAISFSGDDSNLLFNLPVHVWQLDQSKLDLLMPVSLILVDTEKNTTRFEGVLSDAFDEDGATTDKFSEATSVQIRIARGINDTTYISLLSKLPSATTIYLLPQVPELLTLADDEQDVVASLPTDKIKSGLEHQFDKNDPLVLVVLDAENNSTWFEGVFIGAFNADGSSAAEISNARNVQVKIERGSDDVTYLSLLSKLPTATTIYLLPQAPESVSLILHDGGKSLVAILPTDKINLDPNQTFNTNDLLVLIVMDAENNTTRFEGVFIGAFNAGGSSVTEILNAKNVRIKLERGKDDVTSLSLLGKLPVGTSYYLLPALPTKESQESSDASVSFTLPVAGIIRDDWRDFPINTEVTIFFMLKIATERYIVTLDEVKEPDGNVLADPPYTGAFEIVVSVLRGADDETLRSFIHARANATGYYLLAKE